MSLEGREAQGRPCTCRELDTSLVEYLMAWPGDLSMSGKRVRPARHPGHRMYGDKVTQGLMLQMHHPESECLLTVCTRVVSLLKRRRFQGATGAGFCAPTTLPSIWVLAFCLPHPLGPGFEEKSVLWSQCWLDLQSPGWIKKKKFPDRV